MQSEEKLKRVDGVLWRNTLNHAVPVCPEHYLEMREAYGIEINESREIIQLDPDSYWLKCEEGPHFKTMPRELDDQEEYVLDKIKAISYKRMPVLNMDDELVPVAKQKDKQGKYFVTTQLMESRRGLQVVVYAGEKGKEKTQIIVEPEIKRLAFDHTNTHPDEVFVELKATFDDGSQQSIKKKDVDGSSKKTKKS